MILKGKKIIFSVKWLIEMDIKKMNHKNPVTDRDGHKKNESQKPK